MEVQAQGVLWQSRLGSSQRKENGLPRCWESEGKDTQYRVNSTLSPTRNQHSLEGGWGFVGEVCVCAGGGLMEIVQNWCHHRASWALTVWWMAFSGPRTRHRVCNANSKPAPSLKTAVEMEQMGQWLWRLWSVCRTLPVRSALTYFRSTTKLK